jgi:methylmalonyl-CoA/ethylmalonyl-CoA epimerase
MAVKGIDHVVIRVKDLDAAIESYTKLGLELTRTLETPAIGKQAIFRLPNDTFIELVAPLSPDSPIGKAIEKRGEGVHTVCFSVEDIGDTKNALNENGATVIEMNGLDNVAFVHPKSAHGVLVQMTEKNG